MSRDRFMTRGPGPCALVCVREDYPTDLRAHVDVRMAMRIDDRCGIMCGC